MMLSQTYYALLPALAILTACNTALSEVVTGPFIQPVLFPNDMNMKVTPGNVDLLHSTPQQKSQKMHNSKSPSNTYNRPMRIPGIFTGPLSKLETIITSPLLQEQKRRKKVARVHPKVIALKFAMNQLGMKKNGYIVKSMFTSSSTGITHAYYKQVIHGVEVSNAEISVHVDDQGVVIAYEDNFYKNTNPAQLQLWQGPSSTRFTNPTIAFAKLADYIKKPVNVAAIVNAGSKIVNGSKLYILRNIPGILEDVTAKQRYVQTASGNLEATWAFSVNYGSNYFDAHVSADGQRLMSLADRILHATYNVFELGDTDPSKDKRVLIKDPEDKDTSPAGWHMPYTKLLTTEGNNIDAFKSLDKQNLFRVRPKAIDGVFDYKLDLTRDPDGYTNAATAHAFYVGNTLHDLFYPYGFDENAGNFQKRNFDKGGLGNDVVEIIVQDDYLENESSFKVTEDGAAPIMRIGKWTGFTPKRDGTIVNDILVHEYGHGVSGRLIGGANDLTCLDRLETAGMTEGLSDFFAIWMRLKSTDTRDKVVRIAEYVKEGGIRKYPYAISKELNWITYDYLYKDGWTDVHAIGEVWGNILYHIYWMLVDELGFDESRTANNVNSGNTLAMKLIMDSLPLMGCRPTFIKARDTILLVEHEVTGGRFQCKLWEIFAYRGLGYMATTDGESNVSGSIQVDPTCSSKL